MDALDERMTPMQMLRTYLASTNEAVLPTTVALNRQLVGVAGAKHMLGGHGGYVLARDPAAISIVDVVEALEGPISITPCERGDDCRQLQMCSVRDPLLKLKAKVVRVLGDTSIYELAMN